MNFDNSRRLVWFCVVSMVGIALAALQVMGKDSITILNTTVLGLASLPAIFVHVTNKAEVEHKKLES